MNTCTEGTVITNCKYDDLMKQSNEILSEIDSIERTWLSCEYFGSFKLLKPDYSSDTVKEAARCLK